MRKTLLAFDPGDTTGIAEFSNEDDPTILNMWQVGNRVDGLLNWLANYKNDVEIVVIEDWVLFKNRAIQQSGSRMVASQIIGALKLWAIQLGAEVVMQRSDILEFGSKHAGIAIPSRHSESHQYCAYIHAHHYLLKEGRIKSALQLKMELEANNA